MKKLVIFGDSYSDSNSHEPRFIDQDSWSEMLSKIIKLPIINHALSASSLGFSFDNFIKYQQSDEYEETDVIIFQTAWIGRAYSIDMPDPRCGQIQWIKHVMLNSDNVELEKCTKWGKENFEHLLWTTDMVLGTELNYDIIKVYSFLQLWAAAHTNNLVIVLPGYPDIDSHLPLHKIITTTSNFLLPDISFSLMAVSQGEYINYDESLRAGDNDTRINHLSHPNREILASTLANVIQARNTDTWNMLLFLTHLY